MENFEYISAIGQDSHRFLVGDSMNKPLILGGVHIPGMPGFDANSDGDVILHALTNAVSGITGRNILGPIADALCMEELVTDSREYLKLALEDLHRNGDMEISHLSLSLECLRPKLLEHIPSIKSSLGQMLGIEPSKVGLTATTGEGLTDFGRGMGVQALCILTVRKSL